MNVRVEKVRRDDLGGLLLGKHAVVGLTPHPHHNIPKEFVGVKLCILGAAGEQVNTHMVWGGGGGHLLSKRASMAWLLLAHLVCFKVGAGLPCSSGAVSRIGSGGQ